MRIRRGDKVLINQLSLLGAGMAAILAVLVVFNLRNDAKNQLSKQRHYIRQIAPILALSKSQLTESLGRTDNVTGEFLENAKKADAELDRLENGFWVNLPLGHLMIVCAAAVAAGLISGYCSVWLVSAIGTYATIKLIRSAYEIAWRKSPHFDGGRQQIQSEDGVLIKREKHRILSGVLKLSVVALFALVVFWMVVYYITGLPS